jgi:2,3-bisphosphoglycerate-dependent phosphoglycerate mutase
MKLLACLFALFFIGCSVRSSQTNTTTIILVRHAEKDTIGGKDPQLTVAGMARAEKLATLFKDIKPDLLYSTPFVRTRQTLMPWAKATGLAVKDYDPRNLETFANELKTIKGKTIVVAGHSNTTPAIVNFLIGSQKYQTLRDSDYSKLWVVTIKNGEVADKVVEY